MLPVIILCGGLGTRLRDAVPDRPKVLAPVAGTPFLHHQLTWLARQGYDDVVLSTGHRGDMVEAYAGDGAAWGLRLRYAHEPEPLGTGGALAFALRTSGIRGDFAALNGDTFFSGPLDRLAAFHRDRGAAASMALVEVPDASSYGSVRRDAATDAVVEFVEKAPGRSGPAWINAGVYLLNAAIFDEYAPAEGLPAPCSLERELFPALVGRGLYGCPYPEAAFLDIGTPQDYERATRWLTQLD